jgi:hypothetical protein
MSRRAWDEKNYQVTWEDIEPWIQQLEEGHGVYVNVEVLLQGVPSGLPPAVRVTGYRVGVGHEMTEVFREWRTFTLRAVGEVERDVLHLLSTALLGLDNDKWRAEHSQSSLFA